jgi:hypothetical protein
MNKRQPPKINDNAGNSTDDSNNTSQNLKKIDEADENDELSSQTQHSQSNNLDTHKQGLEQSNANGSNFQQNGN